MGICIGIQPAVSFNYGAGNLRRVRGIVLGTGAFTTFLGTLLAIALYLVRSRFVAVFLDDPDIIDLGARMLTASMIGAPFYGIYQVVSVYLQGTGRIPQATLASLLRQGLILTPVLYLLNAAFGFSGLIFAGMAADILATVLAAAICLRSAHSGRDAVSRISHQKAGGLKKGIMTEGVT